jgi:hypothetical protein
MLCHAPRGRQHLALRQSQLCATALRTELETEPSTGLTALRERIRRHEAVWGDARCTAGPIAAHYPDVVDPIGRDISRGARPGPKSGQGTDAF